jgi:hypothetical protein
MITEDDWEEALKLVDKRVAAVYSQRGTCYNQNHIVPDFFRRGVDTCLDMCYMKLMRVDDILHAGNFGISGDDSTIDLVNYARFLAALQILSEKGIS